MEPFEVEFLDAGPAGAAPAEELSAGSRTARRFGVWIAAAAGVAALVVAVAVADPEDRASRHTPQSSVTAPTGVPDDVGFPAPVPSWSPVADAPSVVYLGGCTACARFPRLPSAAVRAVLAEFPGAHIEKASSVISSETGRLFTRTARIRVAGGIVTLDIEAATGVYDTSFTLTDDRVTVQAGVNGFRVIVRSTGTGAHVNELLRFAQDPRLLAE